MSSLGSVEVVSPPGISKSVVQRFVDENETWINQSVKKAQNGRLSDPDLGAAPPQHITLKALNLHYQVQYSSSKSKSGVIEKEGEISVFSDASEEQLMLLCAWLQKKAKARLVPWLNEVSLAHRIDYNRVTVRGQKTRWGSCSSNKNISLNRSLLFVAPELVNYLMIHELSHIYHLNHSSQFWAQVEKCEPNYQRFDRQLNAAQRDVPLWLQLGRG